jgi:hypothetical protein
MITPTLMPNMEDARARMRRLPASGMWRQVAVPAFHVCGAYDTNGTTVTGAVGFTSIKRPARHLRSRST